MHQPLKYRPELDGLRALAVTTVVLYHAATPGFGGGFMGVDVFFVLSGYLITALLVREIESSGKLDWRTFYARRLRRLGPAAFVVVVTTLLLSVLLLWPTGEVQEVAKSAGASAVWAANIWFQHHGLDYFDSSGRGRELLHLWSLGVEEQFYLVWPWLLLLVAAVARRAGWPLRLVVGGTMVGITIVSFTANVVVLRHDQAAAFFQMPLRAFELSIGGIFTLLPRHRLQAPAAWIGLVVLLVGFGIVDDSWVFPGSTALLPITGTALMVWGLDSQHPLTRAVFARAPAVWIGQRSYSWYLWHWPLLTLWRDYQLGDVQRVESLGLCALALLLADLTFRFVEQPIRSARHPLWRTSGRAIASGGVLIVLTLAAALVVEVWAKYVGAHQPVPVRIAHDTADHSPEGLSCMNALFADWQAALALPACTAPGNGGPGAGTIVLWGDSHAGAQRPLVDAFAASRGLAVRQRTAPGCSALFDWDPWNTTRRKECIALTERMLAEVIELRRSGEPVIAVLANRWPNLVSPVRLSVLDFAERDRDARIQDFTGIGDKFSKAMDSTIGRLTALGVQVLVIGPVPELIYDAPRCVPQFGEARCRVPRAVIDAHRRMVVERLTAVVARHPGEVRYFEPIDFFCDAEWCHSRRGDTTLYVDDDHLSATAARQLAPQVMPVLEQLLAVARRHAASSGTIPQPSSTLRPGDDPSPVESSQRAASPTLSDNASP